VFDKDAMIAPPSPPSQGSAADLDMLQAALDQLFAPWVRQLNLQVKEAHAGEVSLWMPVSPLLAREGGTLCGQSLMAAADTAMVLAVMTRLGGFKPMTTVQLQTSFLRAVPGDSAGARIVARVLKLGRSLAFGEISIFSADGQLCAQSTTTYALL